MYLKQNSNLLSAPQEKCRKRTYSATEIPSDDDGEFDTDNATFPPSPKKYKMEMETTCEIEDVGNIDAELTNNELPDLVMVKILKLLPLADLKTCRRLCWRWNQFALEVILKSNYIISFKNKTILNFAKSMKKTLDFPYSNFHIYNNFTPQNRLESFWIHAKLLHMEVGEYRRSTRGLINLTNLHDILSVTPNLEQLILENIEFSEILTHNSKKRIINPEPEIQLLKLKNLTLKSMFKNTSDQLDDPSEISPAKEALRKLFRICSNLNYLTVQEAPWTYIEGIKCTRMKVLLKVAHTVPTLKHVHRDFLMEITNLEGFRCTV